MTPTVLVNDRQITLMAPEEVNLFVVCEMAERDMGVGLGEISEGDFTQEGARAVIEIPDGDPERWRQVFLTRIAQPEEDAFLELGPKPEEPPFSHLGPNSSLEDLRQWALVHYKASGINHFTSLQTIALANRAQFQVFLTHDLFQQVSVAGQETTYPVKVRAYARAMRDGVKFPPLVLWSDGRMRLLEGFHRLYAANEARIPTVAGVIFSP